MINYYRLRDAIRFIEKEIKLERESQSSTDTPLDESTRLQELRNVLRHLEALDNDH